MCGITGIVDLRGERPPEESLLRAMNGLLNHRGPDGDGFHFEPGVGLGHRRLSIIDLEGGKQPLYNEDHSVVVTFNGEIFNFQEIMPELVKRGHTFRTRSDTEVIVHAWEEWGVECLKRFNGMFAFALWDPSTEELFFARDRVGEKPFHWADVDGVMIFGSEIKALLQHPAISPDLDEEAFFHYLTFVCTPAPSTMFKGIKKLAPAERMVIKADGSTTSDIWWTPMSESAAAIRA